MLVVKEDFPGATKLLKELYQTKWLVLGLVFLAYFSMNFYFTQLSQELVGSTQGPLIAQLGLFLSGLIEGFFVLFVTGHFLFGLMSPQIGFSDFTKAKVPTLVAETLRAYTWILLYSLLFLLPGIYKWTRYYFVPYVVFFDPDYDFETQDALEISSAITKDFWFRVLMLNLYFGVLEYALEVLPNWLGFRGVFAQAVICFLSFSLDLYVFILFYLIFKRALRQLRSQEGL